MKKVFLIHGVNLNMTGIREPGVYGTKSLPEIVADITEGVETIPEEIMTPVTVPESEIPQDLNMGFDGFIKPCSGYVSKSFSLDIPVYSSTMSDYRTHHGVDVTGEAGDVVYVVSRRKAQRPGLAVAGE